MWIMLPQMIPLAAAISQTDATRLLCAHSWRRGLHPCGDAQPGIRIRITEEPKWGRLLAKWNDVFACAIRPR